MKARNLHNARGKLNPILYDPRPVGKRNALKSEEMLRNVVLNWQVSYIYIVNVTVHVDNDMYVIPVNNFWGLFL